MILTGTGWTVRELEETPWPQVTELLAYWKTFPPVHILVGNFFEKKEGAWKKPTEDDLDQVVQEFK